MGINKKIIERFNTISFKGSSKWDFSITHYGDIKSQYFIVMERLGDDVFRSLSIYTDNCYMTDDSQYQKIDRNRINELILFTIKKGVINNNSRISEYHKIQMDSIFENMFLPIYFNIDDINTDSQIIDSKYMRHELLNKLVDECMKIVKTKYKNSENIKGIKDIGSIIHDDRLSDIFSRVFIEQYDLYSKQNENNMSNFPKAEIFKTLISQISELNRNFIRNMHDKFILMDINTELFSEPITKKNTRLKNIFETVISSVLNILISNKRNIYQSLVYKNSLLKLSVI